MSGLGSGEPSSFSRLMQKRNSQFNEHHTSNYLRIYLMCWIALFRLHIYTTFIMGQPATQRAKDSQFGPLSYRCHEPSGQMASGELSISRLQRMPLGALHLNESWEILEYQRISEDDFFVEMPLGMHLFSVVPWIRDPEFVSALRVAIHSEASSSHFDFKVPANATEREIHVNVLALGDATAWLFISDVSLPPL